ncbi:MAG: UDP-glucose 4-epimerase GalE [Bdellovibrionales bacterium]|nr:UDP-glucose 4-epimerase GalE [Bdellovibrionales bacterium]NQZ18667.1 UDP-glucose 4-epimerase GalE [Bdellovibrionales bacterium]
MSKSKILVTGGAGYIGSHVCQLLHKEGFEPITYDNLSRGFEKAVQWGPLIKGDLHETDKLTDLLKKEKPLAVMHFAAFAYVGESVERPEMYMQNNVHGTQSLLKAMEMTQQNNLVFSSTCATYGVAQSLPIKETDPQNPINPYGLSKLKMEQALLEKKSQSDLNFCALRYFNAAGADPSGLIGENHDPEPHIIPNTIKAALGLAPELKIFGNDYPTKDGTCVRDFIHVSDLARAHIYLLKALINKETIDEFYNLGNTKGFSLLDIILETERVLKKQVPYEVADRRPGDPPELIGSSEKFMSHFPWRPELSDIGTIIKTASDWFLKKQ